MIILMLCLSGCHQREQSIPEIQRGILDITGSFALLEDKAITLEGEWGFFWDQFLLGAVYVHDTLLLTNVIYIPSVKSATLEFCFVCC